MFLSNNFCYLELHRTGSTQISHLLKKYVPDGKQIGFHNRADKKTYNSKFFFLGSVRNPWDWYISLWQKGCDNIGEPYKRLTSKKVYFNRIGLKTKPLTVPYIFFQQFKKPLKKWREVYSDVQNPNHFKSWLKLFLNERVHDDGTGFGLSSIHNFSGQLTFRYLVLYSKKTNKLFNNSIISIDDLKRFDEDENVLSYTIKTENLEKDFIKFLDKINIKINKNEENFIYSYDHQKKSSKEIFSSKYYDQECIDLVYKREKLIIDKYNYDFK